MTARLKRKLNDLGVDISSRKANENFCLIGTPLPPLEKTKDIGEFVPVWKQEVRDEKGRRRLHGAFTGGFSAGYFNTVGSAEGWTPSTFTSSRNDRAKKKAARPEDFMDEEDLAELREGQKLVDTTEEMDLDYWEKRGKEGDGDDESDSIVNVLKSSLLPAPRDSAGARILKKMGWRVGHGIGPKVTYEQRKRQDALASDPSGSAGDLVEVDDDEEAKKHLYPRRDTKLPNFTKKDDSHGLGFVPGMKLMDLVSGETSGKGGSKSSNPNISAGFGLGALNDADEDDLDVYDRGMDQGSRRVAYEGNEDDGQIILTSRNKPAQGQVSGAEQNAKKGPRGIPLPNEQKRTRFNNGTPVLPGFVVSEKPIFEDTKFPMPDVPKDWTPNPRRLWEQDKENLASPQNIAKPVAEKTAQTWHRPSMTTDQRGSLLGETPLPADPRSVFDYLKPEDRERLKNLATGKAQPTASSVEPGPTQAQEPTIPRLDPQIAKMALQGFQPFTADPVKQARYTAFLKAQAAGEDSVPFSRSVGQSVEAFSKELVDYVKSAQIFKPVSAAMAGRFTSAAVVEAGPKAVEGLHQPRSEDSYLSHPSETVKEEKKEESPKENAARLGMFGPLTREVNPWQPAKLLCKRFGVKEPNVEFPGTTDSKTQDGAASAAAAWTTSQEVLAITDGSSTEIKDANGSAASGTEPKPRDLSNIGLGDDETQGRDILTFVKPSIDIFKAIFASDDEEEEADEEDKEEEEPQLESGAVEQVETAAKEPLSLSATAAIPDEISTAKDPTTAQEAVSSYQPGAANDNITHSVDLASFKPTFVPRSGRHKDKDKSRDKDKDKGKSGKKDKEKKKKGKSTLVSFELEEGGEDVPPRHKDADHEKERDKDRSRRKDKDHGGKSKKKRKKNEVEDDDDSMWVEKPPPEAVQSLSLPDPTLRTSDEGAMGSKEAGPLRGRKRAIDFM